MAVGARAARVRRRPQVAEEPQLLERRLELGARLAPLDPLERPERRLHGGPLPLAGEVRAEARAQLPRAADVERHPTGAPEHVDAGARRRARDERALRVQAPRARGGELDEVGQRAGAPLLGEPDQDDEDLRGRPGVRQGAVARLGRDAEEVRERRQPDATRPPGEEPSCEPHGVHDGCGDSPARQVRHLAVEEREVEPRVVRDQRGVAGEREQLPDGMVRPRSATEGRRAGCRSTRRRRAAAGRPGRRASRMRPRARARERAGRRSRRSETCGARGRSSRGRRRRSARARGGRPHPAGTPGRPLSHARRDGRHRRRRRRAGSARAPRARSRARRAPGPPPPPARGHGETRPAPPAGRPRRTRAAWVEP